MPLLRVEAEKLSNNDLLRGVIEEVIDKEDLFAVLPFVKTDGKAYVYNRENGVVEAEFLDPNDIVPEGAAKFTEVVTKVRILAHDVDVDKFLSGTMSDTTEQVAVQLAAKAKGLARKYRKTLVIGDNTANPKEFDGLQVLVAANAAQNISAGTNGGALTLGLLDELLDSVPNGADVILMRPGTIRAFRALVRQAGGNTAVDLMIEDFGRPMLTHNGVPILENEFIPVAAQGTTAETCSVYAVRLNETDGLHGLYAGPNAGMVVEPIGTVQNKDAFRWRVKWYAGLALKSTRSASRLVGITNV
ncbi:major capsid protein [Stenotrophomonas phage BUCTxx99]|nr:major capsid protein [Stenotrophomonas phage BUCTxx99]